MPRPLRAIFIAFFSLLVSASHLPAQETRPGAATPAALASGLAAALNDRNAEAARALLGEAPPPWMEPVLAGRGPSRAPGSRWHGDAAVLPGEAVRGDPVAVFSAYHPVESQEDHFHHLVRVEGRWRLGAEILPEQMAKQFRIRHHSLNVRLVPAEHRMEVGNRMTVERLPEAGERLVVGLSRDFQVRSVRRNGSDLPFTRAGGMLAIALPWGAEGTLTLEIEYDGVVDHPGWDRVAPEGTFVFSYWVPHIGRLPATAEMAIWAPPELTVIGQGELMGVKTLHGEKVWMWNQEHPVCFLMFAAGQYHVTERDVAGKKLGVYLMKPDPERAEETLKRLETALLLFTRRFGPFPWSQYRVVEYPLRAGGLESYSFTVCSPRAIPGVVVHELAHSWWGGIVPNTYRQDMWNEAFATYSERLYEEETRGRLPPIRPARGDAERTFGSLPISQARNALDGSHSRVGYTRGAAVLHLTRRTIGEERFFRSLQTFVRRQQGRATTWREYAAVVEEIAGPQMRDFFDQWLERARVPRVQWGQATVTPGASGGSLLSLELKQEGPPYRLEIPIAIETRAGDRLVRTLSLREAATTFTLALPTAPVRLLLDPDRELPIGIAPPPGREGGDPAVLELEALSSLRPIEIEPGVAQEDVVPRRIGDRAVDAEHRQADLLPRLHVPADHQAVRRVKAAHH